MREAQRARGEKPRYDGRWRDSRETPPPGVEPVIRFRNPLEGDVMWNDLVKGPISFSNSELDDLVILRADGVPTYNFGVVVDDIDMQMTHVIRGDDHVNNTPRQINIFRALGATMPHFGHVPMILGHDGERLSKRHGAVGVMQFHEDGFLPEALVNYLARLGWSHGDDEIFSKDKLVEWFDLDHISRSPAKFDPEKLAWMNAHYMKEAAPGALAERVRTLLVARGCDPATGGPSLDSVVTLLQSRASLVTELADAAIYFYRAVEPSQDMVAEHLTPDAVRLLEQLVARLRAVDWRRETIGEELKRFSKDHGVKLGAIGVPLRVAVAGTTQTPSIDATLELIGRDEVLARLTRHLHRLP
jgi:glutamyl-tRNA synthetase